MRGNKPDEKSVYVMKNEWFAAKELAGIVGLPSSPQGINCMGKRFGWKQRRRLGVQGKAIEYHIDSLPNAVVNVLEKNSIAKNPQVHEFRTVKMMVKGEKEKG